MEKYFECKEVPHIGTCKGFFWRADTLSFIYLFTCGCDSHLLIHQCPSMSVLRVLLKWRHTALDFLPMFPSSNAITTHLDFYRWCSVSTVSKPKTQDGWWRGGLKTNKIFKIQTSWDVHLCKCSKICCSMWAKPQVEWSLCKSLQRVTLRLSQPHCPHPPGPSLCLCSVVSGMECKVLLIRQ